jgi:hypothetical protein
MHENPKIDPRYRPDFENISIALTEEIKAAETSTEKVEILTDYETTMISTFRTLSSESSDTYYYKINEKKSLGKRSVSDVAMVKSSKSLPDNINYLLQ